MNHEMLRLAMVARPDIGFPHHRIMLDALRALSVEQRAAIARVYYFDESVPEFARRERIPEGTAKSRLHDALHALKLAVRERGVGR
jgi:RNA polymerase sigma-70 factor (ECF subfamily)